VQVHQSRVARTSPDGGHPAGCDDERHVLPTATLSAVWYGNHDLRLEERPLPRMGPADVLVKVVGCGICATDLHMLDGSIGLYKPPKVLGHEVGGVVRAVGEAVQHVRPGDAVALDTNVPCNMCFYCREARPFMCPNRVSVSAGFSELNVAPASVVYRLPDGVEPELGALAEPLSCALHAVERAEVRPADTVAIIGAGALGLLALQVVRLRGATRVIVSEPDEGRRALAERLGATCTVDPTREDLASIARSITYGRGVDCAVEAVGSRVTIEQAFELPRAGGTVLLIGVPPTSARPTLPAYEVFARELTIMGSFIRTTEFRRAVELLAVFDLRPLITQRFPLRKVHAAIEAARRRQGVRVLVGG
jgi:2-desacetyl-2-hydroxyethyl bacteriochlorophyllide A dehydrogenase